MIIDKKEGEYKSDLKKYREEMTAKFKEEIIKRAKAALEEDK